MLVLFVVVKGQKDHGLVLVNLAGSASEEIVSGCGVTFRQHRHPPGPFHVSLASHRASKLRERWQNVSGVGCHTW